MHCCPIASRPPWSARTARSTGCASRASTVRRCSVASSTRAPATVALVDALAVGRNERGHELGGGAPSVLMRRVTGVDGDVELELEYAPRPEYGLIHPLLHAVDGGIAAQGGAHVLALSSPVPIEVDDLVGRARFTVHAGESV